MIHGACGHIHLHLGSKAHYCSNRNTVLGGTMNKSIDTKSKGSTRYETVEHYLYNLKSILIPTPPQVLYHTTRTHQRHRQLVAGHCGTCLAFVCWKILRGRRLLESSPPGCSSATRMLSWASACTTHRHIRIITRVRVYLAVM